MSSTARARPINSGKERDICGRRIATYRRTAPRGASQDRCTPSGPYDERGRTRATRTTTTASPAATTSPTTPILIPTTSYERVEEAGHESGGRRERLSSTAVRCAARTHRAAETLDESPAAAILPHHALVPGGVSEESLGPYDERYGDESLHHHHCPACCPACHGSSSAAIGTMGRTLALFHAHSAPGAYLYSASCDADHKREEEEGEYAKPV